MRRSTWLMCQTPWPATPRWNTSNFPDGNYNYDTIEFAYNKRVSQKFFINTSVDYQWRNDFRSVDRLQADSRARRQRRPDRNRLLRNANPAVPPLQETTVCHFQFLGRYEFPWRLASRRTAATRAVSRTPRLSRRRLPGNLSNFGADFFVETLSDDRSDNVSLLNFRLDKGFEIGRAKVSGMLDIYNVINAEPVTNFVSRRPERTGASSRCSIDGCS